MIDNFLSFLEIMCGFNFVSVLVETFNKELLKNFSPKYKRKINEIDEEIEQSRKDLDYYYINRGNLVQADSALGLKNGTSKSNILNMLNQISQYEKEKNKITDEIFPDSFSSLSLYNALFCLTFLILAGYETKLQSVFFYNLIISFIALSFMINCIIILTEDIFEGAIKKIPFSKIAMFYISNLILGLIIGLIAVNSKISILELDIAKSISFHFLWIVPILPFIYYTTRAIFLDKIRKRNFIELEKIQSDFSTRFKNFKSFTDALDSVIP